MTRRRQFNLPGATPEGIDACTAALSTLIFRRLTDARNLARLAADDGDGYARERHDEARRGLQALGLARHAQFMADVWAFVSGTAGIAQAATREAGQVFEDSSLEAQRQAIATRWQALLAQTQKAAVIQMAADQFDITFVPPADYDRAMIEEITASAAFRDKADGNAIANVGSDGALRTALAAHDVSLRFYVWSMSSAPGALALSDRGILLIPGPNDRVEEPMVRHWPSLEPAFPLDTKIAEERSRSHASLDHFTASLARYERSQARLKSILGAGLAAEIAQILHMRASYAIFFHLAGFGCSSGRIIRPWISVAISAACLWFVFAVYDMEESFRRSLVVDGTAAWALSARTGLLVVLLALRMVAKLCLGVALVHGTILRGLHRQPIRGGTNLPGTGETNFLLRLMSHRA